MSKQTSPPEPDVKHGNEVLRLVGVTKRFGSFTANDSIDLELVPGEIHCLLGENGAGKSTLMNVLYGLLQAEEGEIRIGDKKMDFQSPKDAMAAGIGMVHQHFMLVPVFTVAENMILGREQGPLGTIDMASARKRVVELSARYGMNVNPDDLIEDLPVGVQQRVEILKALANDAEYLVFDEPTAVLTPQEIDELMGVMRALRDEGKAIVFITHKLGEVRAVADRITVIRRGKVVGEATPGQSQAELAELMVGRAVELTVAKEPPQLKDVRLEVNNLKVATASGAVAVDDVSFEVRGGEVLGIAGVQGNGQTELAEALLGTMTPISGKILLDGKEITKLTPHKTLESGLGFVPEDRQVDGLVVSFSIAENLVLNHVKEFSKPWALDEKRIDENADRLIEEFDIRTQGRDEAASSLSGGNQQKVVMARELSRPLSLLVASQPTRGVDVGAIEFLHSQVIAERDKGTAVVIISTELDEIAGLADRVAVMYRGKIIDIVPPDTPRDQMGLLMAGIVPSEEESA